jgi:hypothetical protein
VGIVRRLADGVLMQLDSRGSRARLGTSGLLTLAKAAGAAVVSRRLLRSGDGDVLADRIDAPRRGRIGQRPSATLAQRTHHYYPRLVQLMELMR